MGMKAGSLSTVTFLPVAATESYTLSQSLTLPPDLPMWPEL